MSTRFPLIALVATLTFLFALGCQFRLFPELTDDDTPEIPTDLLYGRDSLMLMPVTADPEVEFSEGNLERFEELIRITFADLVVRHAVPPVFGADDQFRGNPAEIRVNVSDINRLSRQRFGRFGSWITTVELSVEVQFADHETGEPLGEWVDLAAIHGPSSGGSLREAMTKASTLVAYHVRRDLQGQ